MIEESLKKLGFNDKEIQVYLTILEHGKISPARIAQITKIKRPTVYAVGTELLKKGIITDDIGGKSTYYIAMHPEDLRYLVIQEKKKLKEKEKLINSAVEELSLLPKSKNYSIPKIRFIEEMNLIEFLYKQTPTWLESIKKTDPTWWGFQDHTLVEHYREWIDWSWNNTPESINLKLITNDSKIEEEMAKNKGKYPRRHIKFWKKDLKFTASQWIMGDYIIMVITKQKPHYLVEINDPVLAQNLRELFKNLWQEV